MKYVTGSTLAGVVTQDELDAVSTVANAASVAFQQGQPHIIPDVLYPAVAGKLLDGSTSHSGAYGTAQSDTRSYYYTDIKGSKPIKDPRIGAHFGSHRHKCRSLHILEQETATNGTNVYSVDGREWMRVTGNYDFNNDDAGVYIYSGNTQNFCEVVGYFTDINMICTTHAAGAILQGSVMSIDGSTLYSGAEQEPFATTVGTPLGSRFVDRGSLANVVSGQTLGIHTFKYADYAAGDGAYIFAFELIVQDTTSTATKSQIQIPSQNVVSAGKKFTVADTLHYNPFAFKTDGSAWTSSNYNSSAAWPTGTQAAQHNIDTATSLGLAAWVSTNYYYPYNGGRVVVWVDSSGAIKTSVNMMPPNARSIGNSASLTNGTEKGDDSAGTTSAAVANNTFYPTFTNIAVDHSQAEVAKTFHWREFGNGNANGGPTGTYKDFSMLDASNRELAYIMDDGLTCLSGDDVTRNSSGWLECVDIDDFHYLTFIGTGISMYQPSGTNNDLQYAQNLPYGTHILKTTRKGSEYGTEIIVDGITVTTSAGSSWAMTNEFTIYQPKMPPIPEDAVVIADYMLMADFVPQTAAGEQYLSKGVRRQNVTRDVFYEETDGGAFVLANQSPNTSAGFNISLDAIDSATSMQMRIHSFGTNYVHRGYQSDTRVALYIDATSKDNGTNASAGAVYTEAGGSTRDNTSTWDSYAHLTSNLELGVYKFGANGVTGTDGNTVAFDIATPIHTSSHYKTFETPFLHELVGGDRNMEQTNLVVTPDGQTWDEMTRDVSYMGNISVQTGHGNDYGDADIWIFDEWRGEPYNIRSHWNKDWAIAWDRLICLKAGMYTFTAQTSTSHADARTCKILINGNRMISGNIDNDTMITINSLIHHNCKRGDYVQVQGDTYSSSVLEWNVFTILKV